MGIFFSFEVVGASSKQPQASSTYVKWARITWVESEDYVNCLKWETITDAWLIESQWIFSVGRRGGVVRCM